MPSTHVPSFAKAQVAKRGEEGDDECTSDGVTHSPNDIKSKLCTRIYTHALPNAKQQSFARHFKDIHKSSCLSPFGEREREREFVGSV